MHFFKIHHGFTSNPKFSLISHRTKQPKAVVLGVITSLLEYASMQKPRGSVDGFNTEAYSFELGIDEHDLVTVCNALRDIGFVLGDSIRNWEEYQVYDRTGAERQRRYRENNKLKEESVTEVTSVTRYVTDSNTEEKRREEKREEKKDENSAKAALWSLCRSYLGDGKMSLVGKWAKVHQPEVIFEAVLQAQKNNVADPVSYITKILEPQPFLQKPQNRMPSAAGG